MIIELLKTQIGRFRILAFMEGVSFILILFVTMPLKYLYDIPTPNLVVGMVHGVLFMLYVLAVIQLRMAQHWRSILTIKALVASVVPFGTFYMDRKVLRNM
jgi:integral membrane protein